MAKVGGNPQYLIPPKKGEPSRNPKGRGKGVLNRQTIVKYWLEAKENFTNPITKKEEKLTQADIVTLSLIREARKGNVMAFKELMDSVYGRVKDVQEVTITKGVSDFLLDE